jgi:nucleoside-diphosphate-sugar epimerase
MISTVGNHIVKINPYLDISTNLTLMIEILENWRHRYSNGVFNFASSLFVYGNTDQPATEDSYCDPRGFYSITKRTAEQLLISYCQTYNLKYKIMRFGNVIGIGDQKASLHKNALTYMITEMKHNKPINLYNNGDFYRDYIHVKDLCRAINVVINKGEINSIYNIGNGYPIKLRDIINYVVELGSKSQINILEQNDFN